MEGPKMESNATKSISRRPTAAFLLLMAGGFALYFIMRLIQPHLPHLLFDYSTWDEMRSKSALWRIMWMIGDSTEPHYIKTIFGGIGILAGGVLAYVLDRKGSKMRGTPIGYGTGDLFPWVFGAMILASAIVNILFGGLHINGDTYIPTYVAYVSVSGALVFLYGKGFPVMITAGLCSAFFTTPITLWFRHTVCLPYGLPGVLANVSGMWFGGMIAFEVCNALPWMHLENARKGVSLSKPVEGETPIEEYKKTHPTGFFFRRILCDWSEPLNMGSEWPAVFLIVGSFLSWALNPDQPFYGNGMFPELILCQIIATGFGIWIYWDKWMENESYGTFIAAVSAAPACIQIFGGSLPIIIIGSLLSGLFCPPIADMINKRIPKHWHGMFGCTLAMFICSFAVVMIIKFVGLAF